MAALAGVAAGSAGFSAVALAQAADPQSAEWAKLVAAARKEGRVVLYNQIPPQVGDRLKADFEKLYPEITVEHVRSAGSGLLAKLDTERQANADGGDVLMATNISYLQTRARDGGVLAPFGPALKEWPGGAMIDGVIPILAIEPLVIGYNTTQVKTPIAGYQDLLRPEFKGRLGTTEPLGSQTVIAWYDWMEKTQGADFLQRLAGQNPRAYAGAIPNAQAVASGEVAASIFNNLGGSRTLIERGAPLRNVFPKPSFGLTSSAIAVKWSKRPNAAALLVDYMMSRRGQTVWNGTGDSASPLANIPGSLDFSNISPYDPAKYTPEFIKAYMEKWDRMFKGR